MLEPREGNGPLHAGLCFNVGPGAHGARAPHSRRALSQPAVACRRNRRVLRPVVAPPSGARHVLPSSTRAFQPWGYFQPPFILPGRRQNLPEGEPSALCRFRYTRARGRGQQLGALQGQPPRWGPHGGTFAIRAAKREAAGAGAPAPPPRLTRPPEREGGAQPPPRWRITPLYAKRKPQCGACGRQVGRLLVSVGFQPGVMFYVGAGPPRVRAPSSRAPVSTTAQGAQLGGCRVRRRCRVFGDRGARRPRDVAQAERGG